MHGNVNIQSFCGTFCREGILSSTIELYSLVGLIALTTKWISIMATSYQNIVSEEVDCSSIFNVDNLTNSINGELSRIVSSLVELYGYTDEEQDKYKSTFLSGVRDVVIQYIQKAVQEVEDVRVLLITLVSRLRRELS